MDAAIVNWITLGLLFLLPMVSAFVLYRFLPAAGEVGGTLYGVPIKLTGSIAGYVVVLIIGVNYVSLDDVAGTDRYRLYTIAGTVKLEGMTEEPDYRQLTISYAPRSYEIGRPYGEGQLDWKVEALQPTDPGAAGYRPLDHILISYPDFVTQKLTLSAARPNGSAASLMFEPVTLPRKRPLTPIGESNATVVLLE
jgi:hypothetical protein